jgi:hypothetical protein
MCEEQENIKSNNYKQSFTTKVFCEPNMGHPEEMRKSVFENTLFYDAMLCTLVDRYPSSGTCCFYLQGIRSSTLKMGAANFPKTTVPIYETTQCHNPEDGNLILHCCEYLKSIKDTCMTEKCKFHLDK